MASTRRRELQAELARCEHRLDDPKLSISEAKKVMNEIARLEGELDALDRLGGS